MCIIDLAGVDIQRKWLFFDIIKYAYNSKLTNNINVELVKQYITGLRNNIPDISDINVKAQIRFSLLSMVIHEISVRTRHNKEPGEIGRFFINILLNDKMYDNWYSKLNIEEKL